MEAEIKVYSGEIDRLKAMSSKVIQGTSSGGRFVSLTIILVNPQVYHCV